MATLRRLSYCTLLLPSLVSRRVFRDIFLDIGFLDIGFLDIVFLDIDYIYATDTGYIL